ncbi:MAG: (d)CMP kinase [Acidobacteria bacterium]|nr:MAG: (d)CMP kinase [Acidobacteriota bacterium]
MVAIDGVAGSGKSTTARRVASELGLRYLDTGAMYRAATVSVLRKLGKAGISDPSGADDKEITGVVAESDIEISKDGRVSLNGEDITDEIRGSSATEWVSKVSAVQGVRDLLVPLQRELSTEGAVVEGRDIGTVVFPSADVKIFLTADLSERARRRAVERGESSVDDVGRRLEARDKKDSKRDVSPLEPATDALIIDTTDMSIEEVVGRVIAQCAKAGVTGE